VRGYRKKLGVSWQYPGIQTIKKVRADLKGWKLGRALFVADSGMNSEENRQQLARGMWEVSLSDSHGQCEGDQGNRFVPLRQV